MKKLTHYLLIIFFYQSNLHAQLYIPGQGVTDVDGNYYPTIILNGKEWMAENLKTSKYNNGDSIIMTSNGLDWVHLLSGSWVWYNNDAINENPFGKIYNFFSIEDARGLCPSGWRIPSITDFDTLIGTIGGYNGNSMKLKVTDNSYWWYTSTFGDSIYVSGNNTSGFSAYPSGSRYGMGSQPNDPNNGSFYCLGNYLNLWTTTAALNSPVTDHSGNGLVWVLNIRSDSDDLVLFEDQKDAGHAIRCMREAIINSNCSNDLNISIASNIIQNGDTAWLSASTTDPNPSYIWQSDFGQGFVTLNNYGNYSGVTTNNLSISNVQLANHHQSIRAISTSGICVDTSNLATILLSDTCINSQTVYDTIYTYTTVYDTILTNITTYDTVTTYLSVTDTLIINTITGGTPPNNINTIKIFPNPASTHITIDYGNFGLLNGYELKITNSLGQQMFQTTINQQLSYINLSTWSGNGIYNVLIIDSLGNTIDIRKIIIQ